MQLRLLGPLEVWAGDQRLALNAAKQRGVLALLAVRAGTTVRLDWLSDQLWNGTPPSSARTTVQSCVYRLRRLLAGTSVEIHTRHDGYALEVPAAECDLTEYERLVEAGREALDDGRAAVAVARLRSALALWTGEFLSDVDLPAVRERALELADRRLRVLETCLECELELGRHDDAIAELRALTIRHPLRERPWQLLMTAQHNAGLRAEALDTYQRLRRVLDEQLGVEPSAGIEELHLRILRSNGDEVATRAPAVEPRQLPPGVPVFVGRGAELKRLDELLDRFGGEPSAGVCVVMGPAGVGKTTTAVHWARRVADRFPDGQLYADLRGFDPSGQPREPAETLATFVAALGVPPERVPADLDGRAALFRSLLDDRRVLVVLDNARSAGQVRPLLAGGSGCLTLVTSRNRLAGLVATEQASLVALQPFDRDDAYLLLKARLGAERMADDETAVNELVGGCAGLPLALAIVGAQAELHSDRSLAALAAELRPAVLDAFSIGDPGTEPRSVFSWSYRLLTAPAAELFRALGVHPGPEIGLDAAAALAGLGPAETRPLLDELCGSHQLVETGPGRYAMHDLLRAYAVELGAPDEARAARARLLDLMVHTAHAAALQLTPSVEPVPLEPADPGVVIDPPVTHAAAKAWFEVEYRTLIGLTHLDDFDPQVWRLAWALAGFLDRQGLWPDWLGVEERGLAAAVRAGTVADQALAHQWLARVNVRLGRLDVAFAEYQVALELSRSLEDLGGEAQAHLSIGMVQSRQGLVADAIRSAGEAQRLFAEIGHRSGHANALNNLGWYHALQGDYEQAVQYCEQALANLREIGELAGEADTLHSLGHAHARLGHYDQALGRLQRSIELQAMLGRPYKLAVALASAGDAYEALGDGNAARANWRRALDLFEELDHPNATAVRAKLS